MHFSYKKKLIEQIWNDLGAGKATWQSYFSLISLSNSFFSFEF